MGMIWRLSIPKSEEKSPESDEPFKFKDYFKRVADRLVDRHPSASTIICVNDVYDHPHATKEDERIQRQKNVGVIPNEFFREQDVFPHRNKFQKILQSAENKKRLQKCLYKFIKEKAIQRSLEMIYSVGKECKHLANDSDVHSLKFDHSEADTIMISIYGEIRKDGKRTPIVLDSADTDVYVAAAHASHQFAGDFLIKKEG